MAASVCRDVSLVTAVRFCSLPWRDEDVGTGRKKLEHVGMEMRMQNGRAVP